MKDERPFISLLALRIAVQRLQEERKAVRHLTEFAPLVQIDLG